MQAVNAARPSIWFLVIQGFESPRHYKNQMYLQLGKAGEEYPRDDI